MNSMKLWFRKGEPWVWLNAGAVAICVVMVVGLLGLVAVRGLSHFWPHTIIEGTYTEASGNVYNLIGEIADEEWVAASRVRDTGVNIPADVKVVKRMLIKTGNRDITGLDFRWLIAENLREVSAPDELMVVERREWGNFYGYLDAVKQDGKAVATGAQALTELETRMERALDLFDQIREIENKQIGAINYELERLRLKERKLELSGTLDEAARMQLQEDRAALDAQYSSLKLELDELNKQISRDSLVAKTMGGVEKEIPLKLVVQYKQPNKMSLVGKVGDYFHQLWLFLSDDPREANTEGGVFPAIFGTVLMVILMSVIVTPFGVIAAVYLREYAKQGPLTQTIRVAVNNLAGVPSIVYGVFGLGFFVYFLGGNLDALFYPEASPAPVFGTPGLMWASITLALLTLPVVIVATEEGLTRIPKSLREGSLALGATKFETITKVILPMSSPAMMTGLILAIARAAGEVAPLMLVGVVKLAPTLPLDANFPYLHLERKFMHLGFHIYDVGFQSPNVEAARPLVYATAALLVVVIVMLNLTAIMIRNRLREKYRSLES
ncbi:phosphate ABC transporter permease PstA [Ketobacter alkanivorans]|uniref:Phosphate transport system permease protein PstA n=1 Tax=Ketobacter alkanivorans TaxID=1917421 RepID=A0A2K9LLH4_9GAMM|nr:phosphate ABC transporter permease PstA [Ketobacter alkanivorans]AUM13206.1 phosphate ABC transporter, permease protein PstA [Ketobacter alkanivorans]MCP5016737.1 phosphate ABC transporter permease PstA [Ketobacter sp.]